MASTSFNEMDGAVIWSRFLEGSAHNRFHLHVLVLYGRPIGRMRKITNWKDKSKARAFGTCIDMWWLTNDIYKFPLRRPPPHFHNLF
jgi:hypothetical protein